MKFLQTWSGRYPFAVVDSESVLKMANGIIGAGKSFQLESFVRGHHVYRTNWTSSFGEVLSMKREPTHEYTCMIILLWRF